MDHGLIRDLHSLTLNLFRKHSYNKGVDRGSAFAHIANHRILDFPRLAGMTRKPVELNRNELLSNVTGKEDRDARFSMGCFHANTA